LQQLTEQGRQKIEEVARRYSVSTDAVMTLLQALVNTNGNMAQFNHPELGGGGQWMRGGMTMVGDMFNYNLPVVLRANGGQRNWASLTVAARRTRSAMPSTWPARGTATVKPSITSARETG
jgi:hypothetical protein